MRVTSNSARTIAQLGVLLICACSSTVSPPDSSGPADPKAPRAGSDGASRPGPGPGGADGEDPNDPGGGARDPNDPNQGSPPNDPSGNAPPGARPNLTCVTPAVGPSPLRRLTHFEYDNSVRDLLGDTTAPGTHFARGAQADLSHNNNDCDPSGSKKAIVYKWYAKQAATLIEKLKAIPEGAGTMLDNTVILWASEFGDSYQHAADKLTWLVMGNAAGYFRSGRILDAEDRSTNDLHTSLCNAFGIADGSFGNPAYCAGALSELV